MRRSGRTTRMLLEAADRLTWSVVRQPLIVMANQREVQRALQLCQSMDLPLGPRNFTTVQGALGHGAMRGKQIEDIFVDHYAWEAWSPDAERLEQELRLMRTRNPREVFFRIEELPDPFCECDGVKS